MESELTPEMMASSLPGKQYAPYLSPTQTAHYARENPKENNEATYLSSHKPVLESLSNPRPGEDTLEYIMDNAVELDMLYKSKNSLKKVKSRMTEKGKQNSLSSSRVFNHILESLVTERIRDLYKNMKRTSWMYLRPHPLVCWVSSTITF